MIHRASSFVIKATSRIGKLPHPTFETFRPQKLEAWPGWPHLLIRAVDGRSWILRIWKSETENSPGDDMRKLFRDEKTDDPRPGIAIYAPDADPEFLEAHAEDADLLLGKNDSRIHDIERRFLESEAPVLREKEFARWRKKFCPEAEIRNSAVPPKKETETADDEAPLLLDFNQERCAHRNLELSGENRKAAEDFGLQLVTGPAGSGKTLVLLHRAERIAGNFPNARILILTHNQPLSGDIARRFRLRNEDSRLEVRTFFSWLGTINFLPGDWEILNHRERKQRAAQLLGDGPAPSLGRIGVDYLLDEFDWIRYQGFLDLETYLKCKRSGRRHPLQEKQRAELFSLLVRYRERLAGEQTADWAEQPLRARERIDSGELVSPQYDHILVDEAQSFAPISFQILKWALKPNGQLFLCGDPTQGFLKHGQSWASTGLDVRNRSVRLKYPYRNSRAIMEYAIDFHDSRVSDDREANLPDSADLIRLPEGPRPVLISSRHQQDEVNRLLEELRVALDQGIPPGDILVLFGGSKPEFEGLLVSARRKLGEERVHHLKKEISAEAVSFCILTAATGLELPVVFVCGISDLFEREGNPGLTDGQREEMIRDQTRQLYMAFTRAMRRLVIFSSGRAADEALDISEEAG